MPIFEDSRYEVEPITPVMGSDGVFRATITPLLGPTELGDYTVHRVVAGDRLDTLAENAYGDAEFWWRIADANPQLEYPDTLVPGQLLAIPVLTTELD